MLLTPLKRGSTNCAYILVCGTKHAILGHVRIPQRRPRRSPAQSSQLRRLAETISLLIKPRRQKPALHASGTSYLFPSQNFGASIEQPRKDPSGNVRLWNYWHPSSGILNWPTQLQRSKGDTIRSSNSHRLFPPRTGGCRSVRCPEYFDCRYSHAVRLNSRSAFPLCMNSIEQE